MNPPAFAARGPPVAGAGDMETGELSCLLGSSTSWVGIEPNRVRGRTGDQTVSEPWPKKWQELIHSLRDSIRHRQPEEMQSPGGPESPLGYTYPSDWSKCRRSIINEEKVARLVEDWRPSDMAFIQKLLFTAREDESGFDVEIEFIACSASKAGKSWPWESERKYGITLRFGSVRELKIEGLGGARNQVEGFGIIDLSDRGWQSVRWEIEDYENGKIGFYCDEIEVLEAHLLPITASLP
jgi:hypothetical protein